MNEQPQNNALPLQEAASPKAENPWHGTSREIAAAQPSVTSRRGFLFKLAVGLNGLVGAVLAVPIVGYLLGPAMKKDEEVNSWIKLGAADSFPIGQTRFAEYINPFVNPTDGETAKIACWVRHVEDGSFQVFAVNCAHLGCPVRWFEQSKLFLCPCHGGAYYEDGARASGPPMRGLFEYKHRIESGSLMILAGQLPTFATEACGKKPASIKEDKGALVQTIAQDASVDGRSAWKS
jgi:Rieske Fe-S protein